MGRDLIRSRFRAVCDRGEFLVGAAVGAGLLAQAAELGGADFVLALNAGRLRLMGAASIACMLPIHDGNDFVMDFAAREFVGRCSAPVIFGVSVMNPNESITNTAALIAETGFDGVMNFPSAVDYPMPAQALLDSCDLGFERELAMLRACQSLDLWTVCHVRTREQVRRAVEAGVDMVCFVYGWTAGARLNIESGLTLEEASLIAREVAKVVKTGKSETFFVLEGGPIEKIDDLMPIYRSAPFDGYIGGSTLDRLPLEDAVMNQTLRFKATAVASRKYSEQNREVLALGRSLGFVGASRRLLALYERIRCVANSQSRSGYLLTGESGSGRQFVAETVFREAGGDPRQVMTIDAAGMSTARLIMEIFGRAATESHVGIRGAAADAGTTGLIIRGLEHVPTRVQERIARLLAKGTFRPVGGKKERSTTVTRVFLIAGQSSPVLVSEGKLHPHLLREIESREIAIPAVREYVEDIEEIIADMAARVSAPSQVTRKLSPAALHRLQTHDWPGNLPELRAFVTRLVTAETNEHVDEPTVERHLSPQGMRISRPGSEREVILDALWRHGFNRSRTCRFLGISRKTLFNKIRHYNLRG